MNIENINFGVAWEERSINTFKIQFIFSLIRYWNFMQKKAPWLDGTRHEAAVWECLTAEGTLLFVVLTCQETLFRFRIVKNTVLLGKNWHKTGVISPLRLYMEVGKCDNVCPRRKDLHWRAILMIFSDKNAFQWRVSCRQKS